MMTFCPFSFSFLSHIVVVSFPYPGLVPNYLLRWLLVFLFELLFYRQTLDLITVFIYISHVIYHDHLPTLHHLFAPLSNHLHNYYNYDDLHLFS